MNFWKWGSDNKEQRNITKRVKNSVNDEKNVNEDNDEIKNKLDFYDNNNTIEKEIDLHCPTNYVLKKRNIDEQNEVISSRELIKQNTANPFFNNNYIDDLKTQDEFLRPMDSNF